MKIPKAALISAEFVANTPTGNVIKNGLNGETCDHCLLAVFLLQEREKDRSEWDGYLRSLPRTFHSFPVFYPPDDEVWLTGSPMYTRLKEKRLSLTKDWKTLLTLVPGLQHVPESVFFQVRMLVSSRSFSVRINQEPRACLVPLADLLDHSFSPNVSWTCSAASFDVRSLQDVQSQTSITCRYGDKPNSSLLLNYGFLVPNNPYNTYPLTLWLRHSHPAFELKSALMEGRVHRTFELPDHYSDSVLNQLLGFCRFLEFTDMRTLPKLLVQCQDPDSGEFQPERTPPLSLLNEYQVFRGLKVTLSACLHEYETSLEVDDRLLETDLTANQRNCVLLRKGEKAILIWVLDFIETVMRYMDSSDATQLLEDSSGPYYQYFSQCTVPLMQTAGLLQPTFP